MEIGAALRGFFSGRPLWANALLVFCLYMSLIYFPFDFFLKPLEHDEEVWFGFVLRGFWAKATAPLHALIYGTLAYGFYHMRAWLWPWAAVYAGQVAIAMLVWNALDERGHWAVGLVTGALFGWGAFGLWRARDQFKGRRRLVIANERV